MTEEATQENKELYAIAKHMKDSLEEAKKDMRISSERLEKKLDDNTVLTQSVLVQATKTNGRVNGLEQWSSETKLLIENMAKVTEKSKDKLSNINTRFITGISVGVVFLSIIGFLLQESIKNANEKLLEAQKKQMIKETADMVVSQIESKYVVKVQ